MGKNVVNGGLNVWVPLKNSDFQKKIKISACLTRPCKLTRVAVSGYYPSPPLDITFSAPDMARVRLLLIIKNFLSRSVFLTRPVSANMGGRVRPLFFHFLA